MGTYALESIAADYHAQAHNKDDQQEFNHECRVLAEYDG